MSTLFKNLTDEDLKSQRDSEALIPTQYTFDRKLKGIKTAITVAFILAFIAVGGAGYLYYNLFTEKNERQSIEETQAKLEATSEGLKDQVEQYRIVIEGLRTQVGNYVEERKTFSQEFERSQIEVANLEKKLQAVERKNTEMEQQLTAIRGTATQPTVAPAPAPTQAPAPVQSNVSAPAAPAAPQAQQGPAQATPATPQRSPQILTINRKFNFVVVNVGMRDGVQMGEEMEIVNNGQAIGRVRVEKLYENFSAATILNEAESGFKEGDDVRQLS